MTLNPIYLSVLFFFLTNPLFTQTDLDPTPKELEQLEIDSLSILMNILSEAGKSKQLIPVLLALEDKVRMKYGSQHEDYINIISGLSFTYEAMADFEKAAIYYDKTLQAIEQTQGTSSPQYILNLAYYGDFLKNKGNHTQAEAVLKEAFALGQENRQKFNDLSSFLATYGFLANYYRDTGRYTEALPLYLEQVDLYKEEIGEQHPEYGAVLSNLAAVYQKIGHYDKSLILEQESVKTTEEHFGTDNFAYGQRVNNLALCNSDLGYYHAADSLFQLAIDNAANILGFDHYEYGIRLQNMGVNNLKRGKYGEGLKQIEEARSIITKQLPKNHIQVIKNSYFYATALAHNKQSAEAAKVLLEAVKFRSNEQDSSRLNLQLSDFVDAGWILEGEASDSLVEAYYLGSNRRRLDQLQYQFEYFSEQEQLQYIKTLEKVNDRFASYTMRHPEQSQLVAQCLNTRLASNGLILRNKQRLLRAIRTESDLHLQSKITQWTALKKELARKYSQASIDPAKNLAALKIQVDELEGGLSRASIAFKEAQQQTNWKEIAGNLKVGEVALEFYRFHYYPKQRQVASDSSYYVAFLMKAHFDSPKMIKLFEEQQLANRKNLRQFYQSNPNDSKNIQNLLWKPLAKDLEDAHTVYFAPTALLHNINFHAIPITGDEILSDRFQLYQLGSTRQLVFRRPDPAHQKNTAAIFGAINYDHFAPPTADFAESGSKTPSDSPPNFLENLDRSGNHHGWNELTWSRLEIEKINQSLKESKVKVELYSGKHASEQAFKTLGVKHPSPRILHLATHGYFFPIPKKEAQLGFQSAPHPLIRSGLILAGANQVWKGGVYPEGEDGILTAYEIAELDLTQTELVVLSACDTGLGDINGNEGVFGLQRAFKMAGAKYIIMSLWSVKDRQSMEFMTVFYREWLEKKQDIPSAFQAAQRDLRNRYSQPFNPFLWAGFVLVE